MAAAAVHLAHNAYFVNEVEKLARSPEWSPSHQEAFRASVAGCRSDRRKLQLCDQKAHFVALRADGTAKQDALELLRWAYDTFKSDGYGRGLVAHSLATLREKLGEFSEAATLYRQATELNPDLAVPTLNVCRALLRANKLHPTAEILALEPTLDPDDEDLVLQADQFWFAVVRACCADARGETVSAKQWAKTALAIPEFPFGGLEASVRARGALVPEIDIENSELEHVRQLAGV